MAQDDDGRLFMAAILGFGFGIYTFLKGFRELRKYRLVADTPEIPIRSAPMGFVQVRGEARGMETLLSPVTRTPCYLFKVDVEQWHTDSDGGGQWKNYATDIQNVKFDLQDTSGNVLVDPTNAELDLPCNPVREVRGHGGSGLGSGALGQGAAAAAMAGAVVNDAELIEYIEQARVRHFGQMAARGIGFIAHAADPAHDAQRESFLSMLANPSGGGAQGFKSQMIKIMVARKDPAGENTRLALEVFKHPQGTPEFEAALVRFGQSYSRAMAPTRPLPDAATVLAQYREHPQTLMMVAMVAGTSEPQSDPLAEQARQAALAYGHRDPLSAAARQTHQPSGHFRLTEYCVQAGHIYDVTGTCAENPNPRDQFDRNIILKGTNEPTFLISWQSEKKLASSLRKRVAWMILGGAALAVVCLAIILGIIGLL